ncbi:MAG: signal peptide peptidase SppA [Planctomycetota bacterium]
MTDPTPAGGYRMEPPDLPPAPQGRPVSFYLAIFFGFLLLVSVGLNLLLLVVSAFGSATASLTSTPWDDGAWELVSIGGDEDADARLLRIPIDGAIAEAGSALLGASGGMVSRVQGALHLAGQDARVKGVLLEIDSPGGGVTDSDLIWQAIKDFKRDHHKPVVALFGDIAASGGYYVAAACDRIVARPTTITGSIGVIMSNLQLAEAAAKVGVKQEVIVSERTPHKDIMSQFRPMTDEERGILRSIVDELYDRFVGVVVDGRSGLTREQVEKLADGRIYSAKQALDNGLVDEIGTAEVAWSELAKLSHVDSAVHVERRRRPTLGDLLFRSDAQPHTVGSSLASLLEGSSGPRLLYWWSGAR